MTKFDRYLKFFSENKINLYDSDLNDLYSDSSNFLEENYSDFINDPLNSSSEKSTESFETNELSDKEYNELENINKILKSENNYQKYKEAFNKLCKICKIDPNGTVITKFDLEKGNKDQNKLKLEYSNNTKKIHLPKDVNLYHISNTDNIKQLLPTFKGKSQKGYLYDTPRIYFSISDDMPKALADFKPTDKTYKYNCLDKTIKDVFLDPLVSSQGAVYVVTDKPIPVEKIEDSDDIFNNFPDDDKSAVDKIKESKKYDNYPDCIDNNNRSYFTIQNEEVLNNSNNYESIHEMTDEQINQLYNSEREIAQEVNKSCKTVFDNKQELCKRVATIDGQFDQNEYNTCIRRLGTHSPTFDELYDEDGKCIIDLSLSQMAYVYGIGLDFEYAVAKDLNKNSQKFYYYTDKEDPGIYVKFKNN